MRKRVIIESPYAGDVARNVEYARRALRDSLRRGEAPFASHLLYTQPGVLRDDVPAERRMGIEAGLDWGIGAELSAIYADYGLSSGMKEGVEQARREKREIDIRYIGMNPDERSSEGKVS